MVSELRAKLKEKNLLHIADAVEKIILAQLTCALPTRSRSC